jgi:hypothetical protein
MSSFSSFIERRYEHKNNLLAIFSIHFNNVQPPQPAIDFVPIPPHNTRENNKFSSSMERFFMLYGNGTIKQRSEKERKEKMFTKKTAEK